MNYAGLSEIKLKSIFSPVSVWNADALAMFNISQNTAKYIYMFRIRKYVDSMPFNLPWKIKKNIIIRFIGTKPCLSNQPFMYCSLLSLFFKLLYKNSVLLYFFYGEQNLKKYNLDPSVALNFNTSF